MTKKSVEILGLPVISITEGRELGTSKTLLIDAKNGTVAAITIEDEDWYRGVKLLPYSSVIAIGNDAVTITSSENILTLEDASDYETMLDANVRIIGTKAITKSGTIQGTVSEIFVGEGGVIEKCAIVAPDGSNSEIFAEQISIFGKQVTVIDPAEEEKKNDVIAQAAPSQEPEPEPEPVVEPEPEEVKEETEPEAEAAVQAPAPDAQTEDRLRRFLRGKKTSERITTDTGFVIAEAGADITEEVLQKAKLAGKLPYLSMHVQ